MGIPIPTKLNKDLTFKEKSSSSSSSSSSGSDSSSNSDTASSEVEKTSAPNVQRDFSAESRRQQMGRAEDRVNATSIPRTGISITPMVNRDVGTGSIGIGGKPFKAMK